MNRLRALFASVGLVLVSGTTYLLFVLLPQYSVNDAVDAGLLLVSQPARLQCQIRVKDSCRNQPDGGPPPYVVAQFKARASLPDASTPFVAFDLPNAWQPCVVPVGTITEACTVLENGTCSVPAVCAANAPPQIQADTCACSSGANCFLADGGAAPRGATLVPGFTGAGCVSKNCGPEIAGEQGATWPATCPQ